jgi:hypothetical protein
MAKGNLPKLVIFGDPKKGDVNEAIAEFTAFIKGKACSDLRNRGVYGRFT